MIRFLRDVWRLLRGPAREEYTELGPEQAREILNGFIPDGPVVMDPSPEMKVLVSKAFHVDCGCPAYDLGGPHADGCPAVTPKP